MTNSEIVMIVLTAVIAATGVVGAIIFNGQLSIMQGQLSEMKSTGQQTDELVRTGKESAAAAKDAADIARKTLNASNRPWIKVDFQLDGPFVLNHYHNGKLIEGIPPAVTVKLTIKNIGNTPATNIRYFTKLAPTEQSVDQVNSELLTQVEQIYANGQRPMGITLFPNEEYSERATSYMTKAEIQSAYNSAYPNFWPQLVGLLAYRSPVDNELRKTSFWGKLEMLGERSFPKTIVDEAQVEPHRMMLYKYPYTGSTD